MIDVLHHIDPRRASYTISKQPRTKWLQEGLVAERQQVKMFTWISLMALLTPCLAYIAMMNQWLGILEFAKL